VQPRQKRELVTALSFVSAVWPTGGCATSNRLGRQVVCAAVMSEMRRRGENASASSSTSAGAGSRDAINGEKVTVAAAATAPRRALVWRCLYWIVVRVAYPHWAADPDAP
jgi:hypothetical protein